MAYKDFTQLPIWQKGLSLLTTVYDITDKFPKREKYGMTSDMRRSANSVCHNFSEGYGRYERKDKTRFYKIARGSSYELISQSNACYALRYISKNEMDLLIDGYKQIINEFDSLIKTVETRPE